ncbi:phosphonate ABC transporter, permease protein PhnE [Microbulbifer hydrolyticus]|uniref:Phosphonate ABC transporter, permease protein PhnE n=1 Tax=Microbulbifer hydrolyticus TaxID=48074 RepID=A0A6P1TA13_9GAMM|nr:phosphonate ABC transporter, permease protein PhnE [Microbulbifer hydrolyticus]MBB5213234.1 phosphonate transport system permease protein [Microbulbifer hydrolyticus]QHQ38503.1 phosphonate ABC transporter, permease protein PhnE [Microbulbifer hydrolyticus]
MTSAKYPHRLGNLLLLFMIAGAVFAAFRFLAVDFSALFERSNLRQMYNYFAEFLQPDMSPAHLASLATAALETLGMSAIGTLLAAIIAAFLALPAAGYFGGLLKHTVRGLLNALRAIPELVWAALVVLVAGLGPNAGTLALALHTTGVLGRLFAEALENTPDTAADAVRHAGGGHAVAFLYGTLPTLWPQWAAYALYRWENNIRISSVLGFVGAGGLGQMLYIHLSLFQQAQAASVILTIILLVLAVDSFSLWLRQRYLAAG